VIQYYIERNSLARNVNFAWATSYLKDAPILAKLVNAFKAWLERGPKYKFGIEVTKSARHAAQLDKINGTNI
jgi:hypothetical protein